MHVLLYKFAINLGPFASQMHLNFRSAYLNQGSKGLMRFGLRKKKGIIFLSLSLLFLSVGQCFKLLLTANLLQIDTSRK